MFLYDFCNTSRIVRVLLTIKIIFNIIWIVLPIIIIIGSIISLSKVVVSGNQDEIKNNIMILVKKFVACVIILALPTFINYIFTSLVDSGEESLLTCYNSASAERVRELETAEKLEEERNREKERQEANELIDKKKEAEAEKNKYLNQYRQSQSSVTVNTAGLSSSQFKSKLSSMKTPTISELQNAASKNGISAEYLRTVIGTTQREGYVNDPYLYYGWASAMFNNNYSISQMQGWDPYHSGDANYYSQANITSGYNNASDTVLKSVYLALTERNTRIVECDGMYQTTPSSYNCIYASTVYNCSIYEKK